MKKRHREIALGYLYLLPGLVWITLIYLVPMVSVIGISFTSGKINHLVPVGFANYRAIFSDPLFTNALLNNFRLLVIVPVLIFLSLILATFLYEQMHGWKIYQNILFIPVILAIAAMGIVFSQLLQYNGLLNTFLRWIGLNLLAIDWLGKREYAIWSVAGIIIWKELGFGVILFLARLMSVEQELYEAARLDGASWLQLLRHVTVPQLIHVIEFYAILLIVTAFSFVFDYILILTNGGPTNSTMVGEFFIYKYGFIYNRMNIASAVATIYLVVGVFLMIIRYQIVKRLDT